MRLLQVIDIGTNSVRSIIVEVPVGGSHRVVDDERAMTRLGRGLSASGRLDAQAVDETVAALRAMVDIGRSRGVSEVRAIATEAVRRADNGEELVRRLTEEAGLEVEVISTEEEGRLVWLSAAPLAADAPFSAAVDIGGGSVEVVQAVGPELAAIASMGIGVRVLADRFCVSDPISDAAFKEMKRHVRRTLRAEVTPLAPGTVTLVGSGGSVTAVAALVAAVRGRRYESVHGLEIARPEIMQVLSALSRSTAAERLKTAGMPADRADIILPGTLVLAEVLKLFGTSGLLVNAKGFREGIVLDTLERDGAIHPRHDPLRSVRDLGVRYRYEREHAEQVTRLALSIFDQLERALRLDSALRPYLEAAAILHDVGYYIAYDRHHRHSYHLILHSALPGFTQRELGMIASIARYHTKALPKRGHDSWTALEPADRAAVRSLAAILRIADALDRGRGERVRDVTIVDDGAETRFIVRGEGDLHAESYGFAKKKDLFEETFGRMAALEIESGDV